MEAAPGHTYGQNCRLAPVVEPKPDDALLDGIPPMNAQFFYHSLIPIDDPLSTATVTTAPDAKATKGVLRPFSPADNNALERAWLSLTSEDDRNNHEAALKDTKPDLATLHKNSQKLEAIVSELVRKHREKHAHEARTAPLEPPQGSLTNTDLAVCCQELLIDATNTLREAFCEVSRRKQRLLNQEHIIAKVMSALERDRPATVVTIPIMAPAISTSYPRTESFVSPGLSTSARGRASSLASNPPDSRSTSKASRVKQASLGTSPQLEKYTSKLSNTTSQGHMASIPARPPVVEDGISGKPFLRVGDPDSETPLTPAGPSQEPHPSSFQDQVTTEHAVDGEGGQADATCATPDESDLAALEPRIVDVPVGVSRLHEVSLPVLQMKPIYWSPVNDIAIVSRATWFFKDTMVPVDPAVANQLEAGYRELRVFSQEWQDELRCAVEVGPLGEEKVAHPLWPQPVSPAAARSEDHEISETPISSDPFCAARCFHGEASAEGTLEPVQAGPTEPPDGSVATRGFATYHVLYKDAKTAFLLKPSLRPSAYYGRKPLQKILKGLTVGLPVDTIANDVVGEAGAFGCLAVDNIYNILAKEDPIAYLLNGTIDPLYAESLKTAYVPSTATSWFQRWVPVGTATSDLPVPARPPTTRLPSQLELEVHDFTREEVAERKAFLLNDNGQVDYYLRSGSGPLELQYLNMLSAHTSYWTNHDLTWEIKLI
ncbi:hypothetical protein VMCG_04464 [Cytospora schulzeri]|uniref:DDHD domain-containing protein n=1 Tax=Cytospora schulzeri TaxID=448051 RepID=A0A423WT12_9PEZI|nr:hypothetical protein VMCG_04464 [Valsa malicola]